MLNSMKFYQKPMLLVVLVASSIILCSAQTATTPPASAPKNTTTAPGKSGTSAKAATSKPATKSSTAPVAITTEKDKTSYAIGMDLGNKLKSQSIDVDTAILMRGMNDGITGTKPLMSEDDMRASLTALSTQMRAKQTAMLKDLTEKNKSE